MTKAITTLDAIASTVKNAELEKIVIKQMADAEINRLAGILARALTRLNNLRTAFTVLNVPDQKHFANATDTNPASETFSEGKRNQVNDASRAIDELAAAIDEAIASKDFSKLEASAR